ncbi:MAG TPA: hypothetical protein VN428_20685, partial [Bryobacteraceae bacterium]|nr:hypothetical protein [Bryobacteraceae bacterium]
LEGTEVLLEAAEVVRADELEVREDVGLLNRLSAFRSDAVPEAELIPEPAPAVPPPAEADVPPDVPPDDPEPPEEVPDEELPPELPVLLLPLLPPLFPPPPPPPPPPLLGPPRLPESCGARSDPKRSGAITPVRRNVRSRLPARTRAVRTAAVAEVSPVCEGVSGLACQ